MHTPGLPTLPIQETLSRLAKEDGVFSVESTPGSLLYDAHIWLFVLPQNTNTTREYMICASAIRYRNQPRCNLCQKLCNAAGIRHFTVNY